MATRGKKGAKKIQNTLKKEVDLPIKLPDNKVGQTLGKKRRVFGAKYFSESWTELKKVTWPSRRESIRLTFAVIAFTTIFTIFLSIVDFGIGSIVERILL